VCVCASVFKAINSLARPKRQNVASFVHLLSVNN
jgi:hypothetical protein